MFVKWRRTAMGLLCVACHGGSSGRDEIGASATAPSAVIASAEPSATQTAPASAVPAFDPPTPSASTSAASSTRSIAAWMDEAERDKTWNVKAFAIEGVFQQTWLHRMGAYAHDREHVGYMYQVVTVADVKGAAPRDTLQCWTHGLAAPTDVNEGDRVRVEGKVMYLVGHGGRALLPYLHDCKYTRL